MSTSSLLTQKHVWVEDITPFLPSCNYDNGEINHSVIEPTFIHVKWSGQHIVPVERLWCLDTFMSLGCSLAYTFERVSS